MGFDLECPMPAADVTWDDDGNARTGVARRKCGEPLYLTYKTSSDMLNNSALQPGKMSGWGHDVTGAVTQTWEIGCAVGHVILMPADDGSDEQNDTFGVQDVYRLRDWLMSLGERVWPDEVGACE